MNGMTNVLIVDDSPIVCRLLRSYLETARDLRVIGQALDGEQALNMVEALNPDVLTLDVEMPGMPGLQVLERVMNSRAKPVIVVSGVSRRAAAVTLRAIDLGAVDFVLKYTPGADTDPTTLQGELVAKVRLASRVKVIRSLPPQGGRAGGASPLLEAPTTGGLPPPPARRVASDGWGVVLIGASTGGPLALRELLGGLPEDFPLALIVVQHMPPGFTRTLAAQLDRQVALSVKEAEQGDRLRPGLVLVAPGGYHLLIRPNGTVDLVDGPAIGGYCPSIDVSMGSAAHVYGGHAHGVVLTGMGKDGTRGLQAIRVKGGTTFAQAAATCVSASMPKSAVRRGVVDHIAPPAELAQLLWNAVREEVG